MTGRSIPDMWVSLIRSSIHDGRFEPLSMDHIQFAERQLGFALPDDLAHTYLRANLVNNKPWLCVGGLFAFHALSQAVYLARAHTFVTYKLLAVKEAGFQDERTLTPDQAVRHDRWNRGWFPVGRCESEADLLCVDLAPGPAGRTGQVIMVPGFHVRPEHRRPEAYRVVAPSWQAYLATLLGVSADQMDPVPAIDRGTETDTAEPDLLSPALMTSDAQTLQSVVEAWASRVPPLPQMLPQAYASLSSGDASLVPDYFGSEGLRELCLRWLRRSDGPPVWWVLGESASGKTAFLRDVAHQMLEARSLGLRLPLPLVVDLRGHPQPVALLPVLEAHVRQLGGPEGGGAALHRAVQRGQAVLLLDNLQHLGASGQDWQVWLRDIRRLSPAPSTGVDVGARVLVTCNSEEFHDLHQVRGVGALISPVWCGGGGRGLVTIRLDGIGRSARGQMVAALIGAGEAADALQAQINVQGNLIDRLAARPGFLRTFDTTEVFRSSRFADNALQQTIIQAWLKWVQAQPKGPLPLDSLLLIAVRLAKARERELRLSDNNHLIGVRTGSFAEIVRSVSPEWPSGVLDVALAQVRRALLLRRTMEDGVDFQEDFMGEWACSLPILLALRDADESLIERALTEVEVFEARHAHWLLFGAWVLGFYEQPPPTLRNMLSCRLPPTVARRALLLALEWHWALDGAAGCTSAREALWPQAPQRLQLAGANLLEMDLSGAPLVGAVLDGAVIDNSQLSSSDLSGASLRGASAANTRFDGADLRGVDATGLVAHRSRWIGAQMDGMVLRQARLVGARLLNIAAGQLDTAEANTALAEVDDHWRQLTGRPALMNQETIESAAAVWKPQWILPAAPVCHLARSCDGLLEARADAAGVVAIWHARAAVLVRQIVTHHGGVTCLHFSPDHRCLAAGFADGAVQLWAALSGRCLSEWAGPERSAVRQLAFDDRARLHCQLDDGQVHLCDDGGSVPADDPAGLVWSVTPGQEPKVVTQTPAPVMVLSCRGRNQFFVGGPNYSGLQVFDAVSGRWVEERASWQNVRALSRDEQTALVLIRGTPYIRSVLTPEHQGVAVVGVFASIVYAQSHWDGHAFVAVTEYGEVARVDFGGGLCARLLQIPKSKILSRDLRLHGLVCAISPDGIRLVAFHSGVQETLAWDLRQPSLPPVTLLQGQQLSQMAFSADSKTLAVGTVSGELLCIRTGETEAFLCVSAGAGPVTGLAFLHRGLRLLSCCDDGYNVLKLWDVDSASLVWSLPWAYGRVQRLIELPNGDLLVVASVMVCIRADALACTSVPEDWWRFQVELQPRAGVTLYPDHAYYRPGEPSDQGHFTIRTGFGHRVHCPDSELLRFEADTPASASVMDDVWPEFAHVSALPMLRRAAVEG